MELIAARKILLCLRYGIGDLVMEMPALRALRQAVPEASITALGAHPALQLLEGNPVVDRLVNVHHFGFIHWGDFGSLETHRRIHRWLDREGFDTIIDPSHAVMGMAEALWSHHSNIFDAGSSFHEEQLHRGRRGGEAILGAVRRGWGVEVAEEAVPHLTVAPEESAEAEAILLRLGVAKRRLVGISPVASSPLKQWPLENFVRVIRHLENQQDLAILLFHGPQFSGARQILDQVGDSDIVHPIGEIHLRKIAALLARCSAFVGHDTGLMHMAAAAGTSLVALFGPTSPEIYLPTQVPVVALGGDHPCGWRKRTSFGPPACVMEGRCLEGVRSCIDGIDAQELCAVLDDILSRTGQGVFMADRPFRGGRWEADGQGIERVSCAQGGEFHG